jgi:hypothetical protein
MQRRRRTCPLFIAGLTRPDYKMLILTESWTPRGLNFGCVRDFNLLDDWRKFGALLSDPFANYEGQALLRADIQMPTGERPGLVDYCQPVRFPWNNSYTRFTS